MAPTDSLTYHGTDWREALSRNVTVALEFAASDLAEDADENDPTRRLVEARRLVGEALAECRRLLSADPRSNGTTEGHAPDVLPQGMTFHAGELGDAYVAGASDAVDNWPVTGEEIARACDAYVKLAHLKRLAPPIPEAPDGE